MLERSVDIVQIIFADIILSGDNALVIGMAASGLSPHLRKRAIYLGMGLAAFLRIIFAASAAYLLQVPGIMFFGGLLLTWVCWRFYKELRLNIAHEAEEMLADPGYTGPPRRQLWSALVTITIADVSMSIDNVLAVAAIARHDTQLLIFGLALAIAFMAFFATIIMKVLSQYPFLSWAGFLFLVYLSARMIWDGWPEVAALIGIGAMPI